MSEQDILNAIEELSHDVVYLKKNLKDLKLRLGALEVRQMHDDHARQQLSEALRDASSEVD